MPSLPSCCRRLIPKSLRRLGLLLLVPALLMVLPDTHAAPFTFGQSVYEVVGGSKYLIRSRTILVNGLPLTGTHKVTATLESVGEIESVILYGDTEMTLSAGDSATVFANYDFSNSLPSSVLNLYIKTDPAHFGTASLRFSIDDSSENIGTAKIDTRLQGNENISGNRKYAEDVRGWVLDLAPKNGGVSVTETRMTGLIWSSYFGWIDLQPPGHHVAVEVIGNDKAVLSGQAYSPQAGYIEFGPVEGSAGVYIDPDGYFQGTALSEALGLLVFGDYMAKNPMKLMQDPRTTEAAKIASWANTSWVFTGNDAPVVTPVSPIDDASVARGANTAFSFHIEDPENDEIGYLISVERKDDTGVYLPYRSYQTPEAILADNNEGENITYSFTDFGPGEYRWRVKGFDDHAAWSEASEYETFVISNNRPSVGLIYPLHTDADVSRNPEFQFTISEPDGDAVRYQVQVSTVDGDFSAGSLVAVSPFSDLVNVDGVTPITYKQTTNLPSGTLYWRVLVYDEYGDAPADLATNFEWFGLGNTAPTLSISLRDDSNNEIPNGFSTFDQTPTLVWTTADADTSASGNITTTITAYLDNDEGVPYVVDGSNYQVVVTRQVGQSFRILPEFEFSLDPYLIKVVSCDADGDCATEYTSVIIEDRDRFGNIGTSTIGNLTPTRLFNGDATPDDNQYAWNPAEGWIDLNPKGGGVIVENKRLLGYAWNSQLGWIRMNCVAPSAEIGFKTATQQPVASDCVTYGDFGVTNTPEADQDTNPWSNLSGKALVEKTGNFIYFSKAAYEAEHGDGTAPAQLGVKISCDDGAEAGPSERGHFSGWAWAQDTGWISFGWQQFQAHGETDLAKAQNFTPITEWSCGEDLQPVFINQYQVISARDTDFEYPIATKSDSPYAGDPLCTELEGTTLTVAWVDPSSGLDIGAPLTKGVDYDFDCGRKDGQLWLQLKNNTATPNAYHLLQHTGLLRVTGSVTDTQGNLATLGVEPLNDFKNQQILQIVAGVPDLNHTSTILRSNNINQLVADGSTEARYNFRLVDAFGNSIYNVRKYESTDAAAPLLKSTRLTAVFHDKSRLDQVNYDAPGKPYEGVEIAAVGIPGTKSYDLGVPSRRYTMVFDESDDDIDVAIKAYAPTVNDDFALKLHRLEAVVKQEYEAPAKVHDVGQVPVAGATVVQLLANGSGEKISFAPPIAASQPTIEHFNVHGQLSNTEITLTNHTGSALEFDWLVSLNTKFAGDLVGPTVYNDLELKWGAGGPGEVTTKSNYYKESATSTGFSSFSLASNFGSLLQKDIWQASYGQPKFEIQDRKFPKLTVGVPQEFTLSAVPVLDGKNEATEYPTLLQAIAVKNGDRTTVYSLGTTTSSVPFNSLKVAVTGAIHGEAVNPYVIVGKTADTAEFAEVGKIYSRPEVREIMYKNYHSLVGKQTPFAITTTVGAQNIQFVDLSDWNTFNTAREPQNFGILDRSVIWLERDKQKGGLSVNLGSADNDSEVNNLVLPPDQKALTLLVRGGNLYIRDNIIAAPGTALGIIMLRGEGQYANATEGNIFIDPSVTRIDAAIYADGSVMSAQDGFHEDDEAAGVVQNVIEQNEIFDGHNSDEKVNERLINQLLIRGSIVSQNIIGTSHESKLPSEDVWLPGECDADNDGKADCFDEAAVLMKTAQRYDFNFIRRFRIVSGDLEESQNFPGLRPDQDCYLVNLPSCVTHPTLKKMIGTEEVALKYNIHCQSVSGELKQGAQLPNDCKAVPSSYEAINETAKCAFGTPWCKPENINSYNGFAIDCTNTTAGNALFCSTADGILNRKMSAALLIEYDPKLKQMTPPGMNNPAFIQVD